MEDDNLGQGQDNWVNNRSNGGNFTKFIPLNQRQIIISTVNNTDNGVHSAGFWTLKDVIIVSSLTLIVFILSVLFYGTRHIIRKRWPNFLLFKPHNSERFDNLDEQYPKEYYGFGEDQGMIKKLRVTYDFFISNFFCCDEF